jgi:hypothetical protein
MNILFTSLAGQDLTQSLHYVRVMERMGHKVFRFVLAHPEENLTRGFAVEPGYALETPLEAFVRLAGFEPDLLLYIEPGGLLPRGLEKAPFPTAAILCDTHTDLAIRLNYARFFDHIFLYHCNYVKYFTGHPAGFVHWLPYACDLELFKPAPDPQERPYEVAFVGQLNSDKARRRILKAIGQKYSLNPQKYYLQSEIPGVYSQAKIVLNMPLADDLNFRTFEAMSCGALLLTRRIANGQELLFEEDRHYVAYSDEQEMMEKIAYYLDHPAAREAIAAAGLREVQENHRLEQRVEELLGKVQANPGQGAPLRNYSQAQVNRQYAWYYELMRRSYPMPDFALVKQARAKKQPWLPLLLPALRSVFRSIFR